MHVAALVISRCISGIQGPNQPPSTHFPVLATLQPSTAATPQHSAPTLSPQLIVEELVAATDAMSREAMSEALHLLLGSATAVSALRGMGSLGPLRAMLMPIPLPMELLHAMEPAVALTKEDKQALKTVRAVLQVRRPVLRWAL